MKKPFAQKVQNWSAKNSRGGNTSKMICETFPWREYFKNDLRDIPVAEKISKPIYKTQ